MAENFRNSLKYERFLSERLTKEPEFNWEIRSRKYWIKSGIKRKWLKNLNFWKLKLKVWKLHAFASSSDLDAKKMKMHWDRYS